MKKKTLMFILAGFFACMFAAGMVLAFSQRTDRTESSESSEISESVPEYVMPDNAYPIPQTDNDSHTIAGGNVSSAAAASAAVTETSATPSVTRSPAESEPLIADENNHDDASRQSTAVETPAAKSSTTASTQNTSQTATGGTENHQSAEIAEVTTSTASEPAEVLPDNLLITSGDPLHHIRFEFGKDRIDFTGVYTSDSISSISIFRDRTASELRRTGSSFSGSVDVSGLAPDHYIIRAELESGAIMDYVFEMTAVGASPLPLEELPAEHNLTAAAHPLELPEDGVLMNVTASADHSEAIRLLNEVKALSDEICAGLTDDYDKARALAMWVSRNMYYDHDAAEKGVTDDVVTLKFVLENHRSVCFGWSNLYSALCQAQGIECYNASGSVVTGSRCFMQTKQSDERSHSWNMVVIDGRQIWVDTVWCSSNKYSKRRYVESVQDMQYFDISNAALAQDHRVARFEHRDYFGITE